jgi:hypothetical protein
MSQKTEIPMTFFYGDGASRVDAANNLCEKYYQSKTELIAGIESALAQAYAQGCGSKHKSDCAIHNPPALPAGPCDCAGLVEDERA